MGLREGLSALILSMFLKLAPGCRIRRTGCYRFPCLNKEIDGFLDIFNTFGKVALLDELLMLFEKGFHRSDVVGCSPDGRQERQLSRYWLPFQCSLLMTSFPRLELER